MEPSVCPLCGTLADPVGRALHRQHCACPKCDLRFIPPGFHLSPGAEYQRYLLHQNSLSDTGYVTFLSVAVEYLKTHLGNGGAVSPTILDYGSGPEPVLVQLLNRAGFSATGYDPFFGDRVTPGVGVTASVSGLGPFDAVVCTEAVEHFRSPGTEWGQMVSLIRPGGLLVVVTSLVQPGRDVSSWHYATDPTHVVFYSESTIRYISERWGLALIASNGRNAVVLRTPVQA